MISPDQPQEGPPSEEMRYGLLGEDGSTDSEKFEKYTGQVGWDYLRPHYEAGVLLSLIHI